MQATSDAIRGRTLFTLLDLARVNPMGSSVGDDAAPLDGIPGQAVVDDASPTGPLAVADDATPPAIMSLADDAIESIELYAVADDAAPAGQLAVADDAVDINIYAVADDAISVDGPVTRMMAPSVADDAVPI